MGKVETESGSPSPGRRAGRGRARGGGRQRQGPLGHSPAGVTIIGVGASAGGLGALKELLGAASSDAGLAFLVVQHLDPSYDSQLAPLLAKSTTLRVIQAENGLPVRPDTVYTIPPGHYLGLHEGKLELSPSTVGPGPRMSVDFLFRSLASELGERAIGIVLSGNGADGSLGLRAVRGAGGLAVAQDPDTAEYDMMPRSAVATGLVDFVLPPGVIVPTILGYLRHAQPRAADREPEEAGPAADGLEEILQLLLRAKADFRGYKPGTLLRRIRRQMGITQVGTLSAYAQLLRDRPEEVTKLAKDLLVAVTSFFRDPEAYEALRTLALRPLVAALPEGRPLRMWVAGCSTGEEAYSIAMLAREELQAAQKANAVQIFASDLDEEALSYARAGVYPESIAADVSPERLATFFTKQDHSYRIDQDIRDAIVFSSHNMVIDPPFTRMDLVTCRNVLIYMGPRLQERLVSLLSFAVRAEGYLFLGQPESLAGDGVTFEPVAKRWRIYRRTAAPRYGAVSLPMARALPDLTGVTRPASKGPTASPTTLAQRALVEHFAAALVLVNGRGDILYFQGDTSSYLRHPTGALDANLFTMARDRLPRRLRSAVRQALASNRPVKIERASLNPEGEAHVDITVRPVGEPDAAERLLAIVFEDVQAPSSARPVATAAGESAEAGTLVEHLEGELRETRQELSLAAAEHAAANEELRAAHEDAISMNEELRSANEELETSKQELQSVNEELTTLNAELQDKIRALNEATSDVANLFEATGIAALVLDRELHVRRFTPAVADLLNLIPSDVGAPVTHIRQPFGNGGLASKAAQVLREASATQSEVQAPDGRWYLVGMFPYRDLSGRVDGVVVTFVDITALRQARRYAEGIVESVREPLLVLDTELRVVSANPAFCALFGVTSEQITGSRLADVWQGALDPPELRAGLEALAAGGAGFDEVEIERDFPRVGRRVMALSGGRIQEEAGRPALLLLTMEDVTERRRALQLAEAMISEVSHRTKNGLAVVSAILEMQVDRQLTDKASRSSLRDAITRIRAFAALYEQVQQGQAETIELVSALRQVADTVQATIAAGAAEVAVEGEPVFYPFQASTNLVVVANELMTNALKHGGVDATGVQRVRVKVETRDGELTLTVWNSGQPVAQGFDVTAANATGLYLVGSVVRDYYKGEFTLTPDGEGTCATVVLPEEALRREG